MNPITRCYEKLYAACPQESDSVVLLLSFVRACEALRRLFFPDKKWQNEVIGSGLSKHVDMLFKTIRSKIGKADEGYERCQLVAALYTLAYGVSDYDLRKQKQWDAAVNKAINDYFDAARHEDGLLRIAICRCIADFFSFSQPEDDEWLAFLKTTVGHWASELTTEGNWQTICAAEALERIEIMSRNSYMLSDPTYDKAIDSAFHYYSESLLRASDIPVQILGKLYDAAMDGDMGPRDRTMAENIAKRIFALEDSCTAESDERICILSYCIRYLCDKTAYDMQKEIELSTH